tara:strand:- start:167 stop:613 length:447 start_codon:yes stop_codon:yes gene_type:complete
MKNLVFILIFAPFLLFSQSKEDKMQDAYISFLKSEGYTAKVTDAGNISFKYEGENYFLLVTDDEFYFQVFDFLSNEEGCSNRLKKLVTEVNGSYKTLTAYFGGDDCSSIKFASSSMLANKEDFKSIFQRSLTMVQFGKQYAQELFSEN